MTRKIVKPNPHARPYKRFTEENMELAIHMVKTNAISERKIAQRMQLNQSTINRRKNGITTENVGRPTVFSDAEEKRFKSVLDLLARWRFGATVEDFQDMIKLYLDKLERKTRFKNNRPGKGYVKKFRERMSVTLRKVDKIKSDRFKCSHDELKV